MDGWMDGWMRNSEQLNVENSESELGGRSCMRIIWAAAEAV
jgi:hypothetical protein